MMLKTGVICFLLQLHCYKTEFGMEKTTEGYAGIEVSANLSRLGRNKGA